jgi:hypothetical protein
MRRVLDCRLFLAAPLLAVNVLQAGPYDLNYFLSPSSDYQILSATGINASGQIVGNGIDPTGGPSGFLTSLGGSFTEFGFPGSSESTEVSAINDSGVIVGSYVDATGTHGFVRQANGNYTTIHIPYAQFGFSAPAFETVAATGINDAGQIVGTFEGIQSGGVVYNGSFLMNANGSFRALDLSNNTYVYSISNNGYILASYIPPGTGFRPAQDIVMNTSGQILTTVTNVPSANGYGPAELSSINSQGEIVGSYDATYGAFMLNMSNQQLVDLPTPSFCRPGDISDQGVIAGACNFAPGSPSGYTNVGFVLTPSAESGVPEPGSLGGALAASALCGIVVWRGSSGARAKL